MPSIKKIINKITIFGKEATSAYVGFHVSPLSWSNWNLECCFLWREENPRIKERTNNKFNPNMHQAGIKPSPRRWEAGALITAPPILPLIFALSREQFPLAIPTPVKWKATYLHLYNTKMHMLFASNNIIEGQRSGMSGHLHKVGSREATGWKCFVFLDLLK